MALNGPGGIIRDHRTAVRIELPRSGIADPNYQRPVTVADWFTSLSLSAAALALAASMPMLAAYAHGRLPRNAARIGAVDAAVVAIANVLEDPLRQGWAFFALLLGLVALYVGLLGLTLALARGGDRRIRLIAVAPAHGVPRPPPASPSRRWSPGAPCVPDRRRCGGGRPTAR